MPPEGIPASQSKPPTRHLDCPIPTPSSERHRHLRRLPTGDSPMACSRSQADAAPASRGVCTSVRNHPTSRAAFPGQAPHPSRCPCGTQARSTPFRASAPHICGRPCSPHRARAGANPSIPPNSRLSIRQADTQSPGRCRAAVCGTMPCIRLVRYPRPAQA